ncbi:MAG: (4Fe-4S)-binding protein [Marinirhabdus sp.]|nr:(4Fe-4S)-binding protein [Marinirhabdus sp.]
MEKTKEYSNGEVTVLWKPGLCVHSTKCVHGLPNVFKPKEKPWVQVDNASTAAIIDTVKACPSGALSHYINSVGPSEID